MSNSPFFTTASRINAVRVAPLKHKEGDALAHGMRDVAGEAEWHAQNPNVGKDDKTEDVVKDDKTEDSVKGIGRVLTNVVKTTSNIGDVKSAKLVDIGDVKSLLSESVSEKKKEKAYKLILKSLKKESTEELLEKGLKSIGIKNPKQFIAEKEAEKKKEEVKFNKLALQMFGTDEGGEPIVTAEKHKAHQLEVFEKVKKSLVSSKLPGWKDLDAILSTYGMAPGFGIVPDAINAIQNTLQSGFALISGDTDKALKDIKNAGWALGAMIPAGIGQFFTGLKKTRKATKIIKNSTVPAKKMTKNQLADFINSASDQDIWISKLLTKAEKVEIIKVRTNAKIAEKAFKGDVINGRKYYKGANHFGILDSNKQMDDILPQLYAGTAKMGKQTDEVLSNLKNAKGEPMNWKASTHLKPENVKHIGVQGNVRITNKVTGKSKMVPRSIYEVTYPDGSKARFWRSTSSGGKPVKLADGTEVSSEGYFGTVIGHMDIKLPKSEAIERVLRSGLEEGTEAFDEQVKSFMNNEGWFIKGNDWMGYGSTTYKETGAVLKGFWEKGLIKQ